MSRTRRMLAPFPAQQGPALKVRKLVGATPCFLVHQDLPLSLPLCVSPPPSRFDMMGVPGSIFTFRPGFLRCLQAFAPTPPAVWTLLICCRALRSSFVDVLLWIKQFGFTFFPIHLPGLAAALSVHWVPPLWSLFFFFRVFFFNALNGDFFCVFTGGPAFSRRPRFVLFCSLAKRLHFPLRAPV